MTMEQLKVIERDALFVKTPVTGVDIHHRVANAAAHEHFQERIKNYPKGT